ncbi:MAG: hypothetical protein SOY69_02595 [Alloprevotella sp.]|nr:hypothetical protein [Alloprevotella sp.]
MRKRHVIPILALIDDTGELIEVGKDLKRAERQKLNDMIDVFWTRMYLPKCEYKLTDFEDCGTAIWFYMTNKQERYAVCCLPGEDRIEIILPSFYSYDVAKLDTLRCVINDMNSDPIRCRIFYQYNEEDHALYVSVNLTMIYNSRTFLDLPQIPDELNATAVLFCEKVEGFLLMTDETGTCDPQQKAYVLNQRHHLASASMLDSLRPADNVTFNPTDAYPLGLFLRVVCGLEGVHFHSFEAMGENSVSISTPETLNAIDMSRRFPRNSYCNPFVGCVRYHKEESDNVFHKVGELEAGKTLVFIISAENNEEDKERSLLVQIMRTSDVPGDEDGQYERTVRLLPASSAPEEQLMEFDYEWQEGRDAMAGRQKHRSETLTPAARTAALIDDDRVAYWTYWGTKAFMREAWDTAIVHLENAWREMSVRYAHLNDSEKEVFADVGYMLGMAHMRLQQWERSYFYLDGIQQVNRLDYSEAYVEMLSRSHDYRARPYLEAFVNNLNEQRAELPDNLPDEVEDFCRHLSRRLVELYILDKDYARARRLLTDMAKDSANADFVRRQRRRLSMLDPKPSTEGNNKGQ